ncbi:SRPBCC family protein [Mycobacterium asiaticum]|uniref:Polyketide cyclase n=1 Tax=Mycobacterium asiaticum TaxID=1790 RepID=A0A1A3N8T4_MYCAS|nr:SRPBCC family protein [Mycobacterium asiaticum]OBK17474.1 hypothetical protein A5636_22675 [Mycobacterium asiaticum]
MARSVTVQQSRAIPVSVENAFSGALATPLPVICSQWYGVIPPIKQVHDQDDPWGAAGQTRTLVMVGGGQVHETLTDVDPPKSFSYTLSEIRGPLSTLVSTVDGEWSFTPAGTGTRVNWRWTLHPKSAGAAPLLPVFGKMWKGYARVVLEKLSAELVD